MTLYETLGVPPTATPDQIRHAYRKKAARTHPDRCPGDEAEAAAHRAVTEAYECLGDPDRRKVYDETGSAARPRNTDLERRMTRIQPVLIEVMQQAAQDPSGNGFGRVDVVARTRAVLKDQLAQAKAHLTRCRQSLAALETAVDRFGVADGENLLAATVRAQAEQGRAMTAAVDRDVADLTAAVAYLGKCTYRVDPADSWGTGGWMNPLHPGSWRDLGAGECVDWTLGAAPAKKDPKPLTGGGPG